MPERPTSRAEARRRARAVARGELPSDEPEQAEEAPERPSFLRRVFPPAGPLPGRPDPLAGYTGGGALRPITVRAYLLRANLIAWLVPGLIWFASRLVDPASVLGLFASLLSFAALIAAGWIGWQRPTLYGTAASLLGFAFFVVYVFWFFSTLGVSPGALADDVVGDPGRLAVGLSFNFVLQAAIGFLAGWYGGYLRRRLAQADPPRRRR